MQIKWVEELDTKGEKPSLAQLSLQARRRLLGVRDVNSKRIKWRSWSKRWGARGEKAQNKSGCRMQGHRARAKGGHTRGLM